MYGEFDSPSQVHADNLLLQFKRSLYRSYFITVLRNWMLSSELICDSIPRRNGVLSLDSFERNLRAIDSLCRANNADLVLFSVPTQLHAETNYRSALDSMRAESFYEQGVAALEAGEPQRAIGLLKASIAEQPINLQAHYVTAWAYEALGDCRAATRHYQAAIDCEPYLGRTTSQMNSLLRELAVEFDAPLLDLEQIFRANDCRDGNGIVSSRYFADHIHPNPEGQRLIAGRIERIPSQ
ncbi:MAG: hypothetical protein P9M14_17765 [Candidatus Alcyoniella australis]|nr:hypothetical protein [Candidatus Alcyoniella australis]